LPPKKTPIHTVKNLLCGGGKGQYPVLKKKKERVFTPKPPNKHPAQKRAFLQNPIF